MIRVILLALAVVLTTWAAGGAAGRETRLHCYAEGAPPGFSGGFGEDSCRACHFDADLNVAPGRVTIANVPERFIAGERYQLTIALTRPGMKLGGFQLTARFKDKGAQAGTLVAATGEEKRAGVGVDNGVQYVSQRREGAAPVEPDIARWSVTWTAPTTSAPVAFHVAANAADGDESTRGDFVYTAAAESAPSSGTPAFTGSRAWTATTASFWSRDQRRPAERSVPPREQ